MGAIEDVPGSLAATLFHTVKHLQQYIEARAEEIAARRVAEAERRIVFRTPPGLTPLPPLPWVGEMSPDEVAERIRRGAVLGEVVQQWLDRCHQVAATTAGEGSR